MRETVYEGSVSLGKAAYELFQRKLGQSANWHALPEPTKEAWIMLVEHLQDSLAERAHKPFQHDQDCPIARFPNHAGACSCKQPARLSIVR